MPVVLAECDRLLCVPLFAEVCWGANVTCKQCFLLRLALSAVGCARGIKATIRPKGYGLRKAVNGKQELSSAYLTKGQVVARTTNPVWWSLSQPLTRHFDDFTLFPKINTKEHEFSCGKHYKRTETYISFWLRLRDKQFCMVCMLTLMFHVWDRVSAHIDQ